MISECAQAVWRLVGYVYPEAVAALVRQKQAVECIEAILKLKGLMGQDKANELASRGWNYERILRYFYGADLAIEPFNP